MCGIFGFAGKLKENKAERCTNTLSHRGPDGFGLWSNDRISLGHRRLAILDVSDQGKQPMSYANGRYWIIFNGEIYNFLELRSKLESKGHLFRSETDTEVVLAAFAEWGDQCLKHFNGMWAFAIWDAHEESLFLARDRFGKKPLFYSFLPSGFAFASEMKAIFPLLDEIRPDSELVRDISAIFRYEATERCIIQGINRFPAGHYGYYENKKLRVHRYWNTLDHLVHVPERYEDQVEQFRELFIDACRLRMRSDVSIGTALSGGLDSSSVISTVAHIARNYSEERMSSDWQHAFVAAFPGTFIDETRYAKMVAEHLDIEATFLEIDPLSAIDNLENYLYLFEELYLTPPIPFMLTYGAMKDKGVKVTIDGHGADECFGGYPFDLVAALHDARLNIREIHTVLKTIREASSNNSEQAPFSDLKFWIRWQANQMARKVLMRQIPTSADSGHSKWKALDHLTRQLYISTHETTLPTILRNYDRYSMSNGVEIRMPFMDHRIVAFAFSLPWTSKIRKGFSKSIIRDAMSPFLPHDVAFRKLKIGFNSPIVDWIKGPLRQFFQDIVHSQSFKICDLLDPPKVTDRLNKVLHDSGATFNDGEQVWRMLTPYFWEQAVLKRKTF